MKKIYTFISIIALGFMAVSCEKEMDNPDQKPLVIEEQTAGESFTVILTAPDSEETKTALGSKSGSSYPVKWSSGDQNRVFLNGSAPTASNKDSDTQITATFKPGSLSVYNFLYRGDAGHDNQVTIPAAQTYYANDFDDAAMPMYAASATRSNTVTFSHLCALLKFSITGSKKIDSVTLTPVDDSKSLSGTFTIGKTGAGLLDGTLTPAAGGGTVVFSFPGHLQLSGTASVFYVAIPAGTYPGGLDVLIVDNNQGHMHFKVLRDNSTITAGKVRELGTFAYEQVKDPTLHMIYDAKTFSQFVYQVNVKGNTNLNARLTPAAETLSLPDSTVANFNSIIDYQGTFDGNGKTISHLNKPLFNNLKGVVKNLTLNSTISITDASDYNLGIFARQVVPSAEIDDIAGLQNCTAKGSITYTPSSALSTHPSIGGMVGNNLGGAFINCTNEATVTFANNGSVTHTGDRQPSIGGVVGRSQKGGALNTNGNISSCSNTGTVSCEEQFGGNIMIGGIIGYGVEVGESISGCSNSGLVKATSTCTTDKVLHIGGVAGMFKGTVESCSNLTAGTVTTESGSAAGTYLCQGGVFGRLNNGSETYSGISNAGTVNVAAVGGNTLRLIGGVVGRCNEGAKLTECTNSGNINYTAEEAADKGTYIGGIVASNTASGTTLTNCYSTGGAISYTGETLHGPLYIGGVVGYSTRLVSGCTNAMAVEMGGSFTATSSQYFSLGGIVGKVSNNALISSCLNTGNVTYSQQLSGSNGYTFVGGIVGHTNGSIENTSNGGTVTITGKNDAQNPYFGGVVGSTDSANSHSITGKYASASATNYGSVVVNTTAQSKKYVHVGGVAGRLHTNGSMTATNNGPITVTSLTCTYLYLGGLVGLTNDATSVVNEGSANMADGDITVSGLTSKDMGYIGGLVGRNNGAVTGGTNAGDVVVTSGTTSVNDMYVAGIVARGAAAITSCTNSGLISNAGAVTGDGKWLEVGGIVGYNASGSNLSECVNNGAVTNSGTSKGHINIGGVSADCGGTITSCHNTGAVSNSGATLTQKTSDKIYQLRVGGVIGGSDGTTVTSCYNTGAVSNTANAGAGTLVGGLCGQLGGGTVVTCYNTGAVSNSGVAYDSAERGDVIIGGLVGLLNGDVTLTGTSSAYNYNNGPVSETSSTGYVAIAGVAGDVKGNCNLTYVKNLANGDLTVSGNTRNRIYMGGCVGMVQRLFTMNDASNAGDLNFSGITLANSSEGNAIAGGVIGSFSMANEDTDEQDSETVTIQNAEFTFYRLTNSGRILVPSSGSGNNMKSAGTKTTGYSYFGGVAGVGDTYSKNFYNCTNSGRIQIYNQVKSRVGGVLGYTNHNPTGCVNTGSINYCRYAGGYTKGNGEIGGVVGYMNITTPTDLTNDATVRATGSSPNCYVGGIIGRTNTETLGFKNCYVGTTNGDSSDRHTISGASEGSYGASSAGLFSSDDNTAHAWDFTGCKIKNGTYCQNVEISSELEGWNNYLIGRKQATSVTNAPTFVASF